MGESTYHQSMLVYRFRIRLTRKHLVFLCMLLTVVLTCIQHTYFKHKGAGSAGSDLTNLLKCAQLLNACLIHTDEGGIYFYEQELTSFIQASLPHLLTGHNWPMVVHGTSAHERMNVTYG